MSDDESLQASVAWLKQRGPAVILGNPSSLFVTQLGKYWQRLGLDVHIVSTGPNLPDAETVGVPVIDSLPLRPRWMRLARAANVLLRPTETALPWLRRHRYRQRTGLEAPRCWELHWVDHYWDSYSRARAALRLKPAFVFAQEAAAYGLAAARCHGTTRVVFPWGADIYLSCEASPIIAAMIRRAFNNVELIVPSSQTAKDRICQRFDVPPERVEPVSWGVDLDLFQPLTGADRSAVRNRFGIPAESVVVMNTRRFDPLWGGNDALKAALHIATQRRDVFCVFLGAGHDSAFLTSARERVRQAGLSEQFLLLEQAIPLDQYAQLVGVSDVSLSLMTVADMRSSSVLQAAAAGGVPVIGDTPEHRLMKQQGFACCLIPAGDHRSLLDHLSALVSSARTRDVYATANRRYLSEHENYHCRMSRLLEIITNTARQRNSNPSP